MRPAAACCSFCAGLPCCCGLFSAHFSLPASMLLPAWCLPAGVSFSSGFADFSGCCLLLFFLRRLIFVFFLLLVLLLLCVCRNTDSEGQRENCCADCSYEFHKVLPPLSNRCLFLPYCKLPVVALTGLPMASPDTRSSTLRFCCRPAELSLEATGKELPKPLAQPNSWPRLLAPGNRAPNRHDSRIGSGSWHRRRRCRYSRRLRC